MQATPYSTGNRSVFISVSLLTDIRQCRPWTETHEDLATHDAPSPELFPLSPGHILRFHLHGGKERGGEK